MRARSAFVPGLVAVALLGAGCGGDDEPTATPTAASSGEATPPPQVGEQQSGATGSGVDATPGDGAQGSGGTPADVDTGIDEKDSLATQISKNPDLRTLSTALNAAGLGSIVDRGNYTVFAPNNDAFTKLGTQLDTLLQPGAKSELANILKFHVVRGKVRARKLKDGTLLTTLQGTRLRVTVKDGQTQIGNSLGKAAILVPDAKASNGVIHTIDSVLKPKN
ncbi:MAG: fasciclin domain-containing protein [Patulibacter minatonensis]